MCSRFSSKSLRLASARAALSVATPFSLTVRRTHGLGSSTGSPARTTQPSTRPKPVLCIRRTAPWQADERLPNDMRDDREAVETSDIAELLCGYCDRHHDDRYLKES